MVYFMALMSQGVTKRDIEGIKKDLSVDQVLAYLTMYIQKI